jgi:hypothetical protein
VGGGELLGYPGTVLSALRWRAGGAGDHLQRGAAGHLQDFLADPLGDESHLRLA